MNCAPRMWVREGALCRYVEDRGASCCLECQGSYKFQHDTDKNLMFMHVFPNVTLPESGCPLLMSSRLTCE